MATETPSISRPKAPLASLDYDRLVKEGIHHIEAMSGKIWTDYNTHDPGIAILEVLCYAITELGFRCDYEIRDILAPRTGVFAEFSTLASAGSNAPLTINDFRKILIDLPGHRNAWIERVEKLDASQEACNSANEPIIQLPSTNTPPSTGTPITNPSNQDAESAVLLPSTISRFVSGKTIQFNPGGSIPVSAPDASDTEAIPVSNILGLIPLHLDRSQGKFLTNPSATSKEVLIKGLYNVFIQFAESPEYGNLNDNTFEEIFNVKPIGYNQVVPFLIEVEFPIWEEVPEEFDALISIIEAVAPIDPDFADLSQNGAPIFSLDVESISILPEEEFNYYIVLAIKAGNRVSNIRLRLRVVDGQAFVINDEEFMLRMADEFRDVDNSVNVATGTAPIARYFGGDTDRPEYKEAIGVLVRFMKRRVAITKLLLEARKALAQHRNLCEDFVGVYPMSHQEIGLDVEAEIKLGFDADRVMGEIFYRTEQVLSPKIQFRTLREMLDRGWLPEEIFRGPRLQNGFIDETEPAFQLQDRIIYTSDLLQEYMKIPGIVSIRKLELSHYVIGKPAKKRLSECLYLENPARYLPNLNISRSKVKIDSGPARVAETSLVKAIEYYGQFKALRQLKGTTTTADFDIPTGEFADVEHYYSIQHEFPSNYGIGIEGLAASEPNLRKAQAAQLKAYLLFFDQLLANFLSQLAHIRDLFSYSDEIERTYYTQALFEVPDVRRLLRDYTGSSEADWAAYISLPSTSPDHIRNKVNALAESPAVFNDRRKRFLDHLIGRFNETFADYASYVFSQKTDKDSQFKDIHGKQGRFLRSYDEHASRRAQGWDYQGLILGDADRSLDFSDVEDQISGLKRRVFHLAGLPQLRHEFINPFEQANFPENGGEFGFELWTWNAAQTAKVVFLRSAKTDYANLAAAKNALVDAFELALDPMNFQKAGNDFVLYRSDRSHPAVVAYISSAYISQFPSELKGLTSAHSLVKSLYSVENLHIVEHILLRQRKQGDVTLLPRIKANCRALDIEDPYSFRVTVVLPTWAGRFREADYRRVFKQIIRSECPAHVYIRFMWLDPIQMEGFEHSWKAWLNAVGNDNFARLLWEDDDHLNAFSKPSKAPMTQENFYYLLLEPKLSHNEEDRPMVESFNSLRNLLEARYVLNRPKVLELYEPCEVLAYPVDPDGEITAATIMSGSLPPGVCLDICSGEIRINNLDLFKGINDLLNWPLQILTINSSGEETWHGITLAFIPNKPARVSFGPVSKHIAKYQDEETLVMFRDGDTYFDDNKIEREVQIVMASLIAVTYPSTYRGTQALAMPAGMKMDSESGEIKVTDRNLLQPGAYVITVGLTDALFGVSILTVTINIIPDTEATFSPTTMVAKNEDAYLSGDVLYRLTDIDEGIDTLTLQGITATNLLAQGMAFVQTTLANGQPAFELRITDADAFRSSLPTAWSNSLVATISYYSRQIRVFTKDVCGGTSTLVLTLKVRKDNTPAFAHNTVKGVSFYATNEIIAYISDNIDGGISGYTNMTPALPPGITAALETMLTRNAVNRLNFKVSSPSAFAAYVNAQAADSANIVNLPFSVMTFDASGGKGLVYGYFRAKKDNPPIVNTPMKDFNIDVFKANDLVAQITDVDNGIKNATHVGGVPLAGIGLTMYAASIGNTSQSGRTSGGLGARMALPIFDPTITDVTFRITNLSTFIAAVVGSPYFVLTNARLGIVRASFQIRTVDNLDGVATSTVNIDVRRDIETRILPIRNNEPINNYQGGEVLFRLNVGDVSATFTAVTFAPKTAGDVPPMEETMIGMESRFMRISRIAAIFPPGISHRIQGNICDVYVSDKDALVAGSKTLTANTVDSTGGISSLDFTIILQRKFLTLAYEIVPNTLYPQSHLLNVDDKVPGLEITSLTSAFPRLFGTMMLGDGTVLAFTEGSGFGTTYRTPQSISFLGTITSTNQLVQGKITISPKLNTPIDRILEETIMTTSSAFEFRSAISGGEEGERLQGSMEEVSEQSLTLIANFGRVTGLDAKVFDTFRTGNKDVEMSTGIQRMLAQTAESIKETQGIIESTSGEEQLQAREDLSAYVGTFQELLQTAVTFAGQTKVDDLQENDAMSALFDFVNTLIEEMK